MPREQLRVLLDEEARAEVAAGLLVREHDEHEIAGELDALPLRTHEGADEHRDAGLHVERAAAPDDSRPRAGPRTAGAIQFWPAVVTTSTCP